MVNQSEGIHSFDEKKEPYNSSTFNSDIEEISNNEENSPELVAAEKSLLWKLDFLYVMPCIAILNFLQFFDKSALNYSALLGIKEDTNITDSQFGWLGSIFYLGYLLYQVSQKIYCEFYTSY